MYTLAFAIAYWIAFITAAQFIMLNLFVLVVLEQFETYYINPNNPMKNFKDDVEIFKEAWKPYSIKYQGLKIKETALLPFFASFKEPLGISSALLSSYLMTVPKALLRKKVSR